MLLEGYDYELHADLWPEKGRAGEIESERVKLPAGSGPTAVTIRLDRDER